MNLGSIIPPSCLPLITLGKCDAFGGIASSREVGAECDAFSSHLDPPPWDRPDPVFDHSTTSRLTLPLRTDGTYLPPGSIRLTADVASGAFHGFDPVDRQ